MSNFLKLFIIVLLFSCSSKNNKTIDIEKKTFSNWYFKDFKKDSVLGLSLEKLYQSDFYKKNKIKDTIIVAVIDTEIDTKHEDLKGFFWKNNQEKPNGKDDDLNGYVDDLNGWNFIGNSKGENIIFSNFSHIKVIKKFDSIFKNKSLKDIETKDIENFKNYQRALADYEDKIKEVKDNYKYVDFLKQGYPKAKKTVDSLLNTNKYTFKETDSLYSLFEDKDSIIAANIYFMSDFLKYEMEGFAEDLEADNKRIERFSNNVNYNDRAIIGDDVNNIYDSIYGNKFVSRNIKELTHGTRVTSLIAANKNNKTGIEGIYNGLKILPLCVAPKYGPERDKDLALAIKYAVKKGAKIINISLSRSYQINYNFVEDALRYAENNNVLVIKGAGNSSENLDEKLTYPNKYIGKDTLTNFIVVGASGKYLETSKPIWASYGESYVDLFAPGEDIISAYPSNDYKPDAGSSLSAAITSGVAAMLLSKFPDLKPKDLIKILKQSSTKIDTEVFLDYDGKVKKMFSNLSESGGILNAYNAYKAAYNRDSIKN